MGTYDEDTKRFIDQVVGEYKERPARDKVRQALGVARQLSSGGGPAAASAKFMVSEGIRRSMNEKAAAESFEGDIKKIPVLKLADLFNSQFGEGWDDWEPETIRIELKETLGIDAGPKIMNIIGALQTVINTSFPFELWHVFENVSHAFNENPVSFAIIQPAELDEIALTIEILKGLRPKEEFSDDVCGYIASVAKNSGVVYLPPRFYPSRCQDILDQMNNDLELKKEVEETWPNFKPGDGRLAIQTQRLREINDYVRDEVGL